MQKISFILLLFFLSFNSLGQEIPGNSLMERIYTQITERDSIHKWEIDRKSETIKCLLIGQINFKPLYGENLLTLKDKLKTDTIIITLRFEKGWNQERTDSLIKSNQKIIAFLKARAIHYCDSINWRIKIDRMSFSEEPYKTLNSYWRFRKYKNYDIADVVRIPDVRGKDIGVFVDISYDYQWYTISSEKIRQQLLSKLQLISFEILKTKKLLNGKFEFDSVNSKLSNDIL